jgi:DNA-binding GntR family transcriptional regulator
MRLCAGAILRAAMPTVEGAAMEYSNLGEIAYKKIKNVILKREIVAGERLSDDELALRLRLNQSSIRKALERLAQEGYVSRFSNRGFRVSEVTAEELVELFDLRQLLEAYCVDEASQRITPDGIEALEQSVKASRKAIVSNQPLIERYITNKDFHLIIADIAGNGAVCRALEDSCEKLLLKRRIEGESDGGFAVLRHHREILRAIKCQDGKKAQELMRAHLDELKYTMIKQIAIHTRTAQAH